MSQEHQDPLTLRHHWLEALGRGWEADGPPPSFEAVMPFYGVELAGRTAAPLVAETRAESVQGSPEFQLEMLQEVAAVRDVRIEASVDLPDEQQTRGINDWEGVRKLCRAIEERMPIFGKVGLSFVQQADAYLNGAQTAAKIDSIVQAELKSGPAVVIAHSLGTIVAYSVLRRSPGLEVPLFLTLGSPLGMRRVRSRLSPQPLTFPLGVGKWVNVADRRDPVALHPLLDDADFGGRIENLDPVTNRYDDPHNIADYLSNRRVAEVVLAALEPKT